MVLVNFPADWVLRYHQLGHAEWNGATATDIIFPEFLLLSGFSMVYSFASRCRKGETRTQLVWHVVLRSLMLIGLGLLLNAFPAFDWHMLHVFGVLQRIGLCYLVGGLLVLGTRRPKKEFEVNVWAIVVLILLILIGVWAAVRFVRTPGYGVWRFDHDGNLGAVIDRAIMGNRHLSDWGGPGRMWDADGLLSCVTSIPNFLVGVLAAVWVRREASVVKTFSGMLLLGVALTVLALLLHPYFVINRKLWTDSFALLSSGISLGLFAIFYFWLDGTSHGKERRRSWWLTPALVYGSNAILGFALYSILLAVHGISSLPGAHAPANWLPLSTYTTLCNWVGPYNVSLLYGLLASGFVMALLWPFYTRKVFLKL